MWLLETVAAAFESILPLPVPQSVDFCKIYRSVSIPITGCLKIACNSDSGWSLARMSRVMHQTAIRLGDLCRIVMVSTVTDLNVVKDNLATFCAFYSPLETEPKELKQSLVEQANLSSEEKEMLEDLPDQVFDPAIDASLSALADIVESLRHMEHRLAEGPEGYIKMSGEMSGWLERVFLTNLLIG